MGLAGVLERELVQAEHLADTIKLSFAWLFQPDPDELGPALAEAGRLFQFELALVLALSVPVMGAVDDHALDPR